MLTYLILAVALAGQCQPGMPCYRPAYGYAPQMVCSGGSCYQPSYAPYIPPQPAPAPAPAPAPSPSPLRPVPPSPYRSVAAAAPAPSALERKVDALAKQVEALVAKSASGCPCGDACECGRSRTVTAAFRFH